MDNTNLDYLDVTSNIKAIEKLKSELLGSVSKLYDNLLQPDELNQRVDILAQTITLNYLLAKRVGVSFQELDTRILEQLRLGVLDTDNYFHADLAELLDRKRSK